MGKKLKTFGGKMSFMTAKQRDAMNKRRYGKRGKKPTQAEIRAAFARQSPDHFHQTDALTERKSRNDEEV